jgi:hypothetical protein
MNRKQLLLNFINILESTTKIVKKENKKSPDCFIIEYGIKSFKTSKFYYLKVFVKLDFL